MTFDVVGSDSWVSNNTSKGAVCCADVYWQSSYRIAVFAIARNLRGLVSLTICLASHNHLMQHRIFCFCFTEGHRYMHDGLRTICSILFVKNFISFHSCKYLWLSTLCIDRWMWMTGSVLNDVYMCCCSLTFSGSRCWLRVGQLHLRDSCVNASFCSHSTLVVYLMVVCQISQYPLCCQFTQLIKNVWSHALLSHWHTVVDWWQFSALLSSMNIVKRNAAVDSLAHAIQTILMWRHAEHLLYVQVFSKKTPPFVFLCKFWAT